MKSSVITLKHAVKALKAHHRMHVEESTRMAYTPQSDVLGSGLAHQPLQSQPIAALSFNYAIALQGWDSAFLICNLLEGAGWKVVFKNKFGKGTKKAFSNLYFIGFANQTTRKIKLSFCFQSSSESPHSALSIFPTCYHIYLYLLNQRELLNGP